MLFVIFDLLIMRILIVMSISNVFFIISDRRYYWRNFIIFAFAIRLIFNDRILCYGRLLIVPYGIETEFKFSVLRRRVFAFNRTLWN